MIYQVILEKLVTLRNRRKKVAFCKNSFSSILDTANVLLAMSPQGIWKLFIIDITSIDGNITVNLLRPSDVNNQRLLIMAMKDIFTFHFRVKDFTVWATNIVYLNVRKVYHCQGSEFTDRAAVSHQNCFNSHANQTIHGKTTTFLFQKIVIKSTKHVYCKKFVRTRVRISYHSHYH